jgi:hypothetical protein
MSEIKSDIPYVNARHIVTSGDTMQATNVKVTRGIIRKPNGICRNRIAK